MKFIQFFDPTKHRDLLKHGRLFVIAGFAFSIVNLILIPIVGIPFGIDFAGGTEMQIKFSAPVSAEKIRDVLAEQGFKENQVQQYGKETDNEWLVRVERMTILSAEKVKDLDGVMDQALGQDVRVEFRPAEGDRFMVFVKEPDTGGDAVAEVKALEEISQKIGAATEDKGGLQLRRTKAAEGQAEGTQDAILRDDPYRGEVRFTVQLQGVSDKLTKALSTALGQLEVRRVDFVDATVAESLKTDGIIALVISLALILVYVAIRFDIFFGPGAIIALIHDPIGALCVYTIGRLEFDLPSVAGLLTVVGYSISHTIVIYDRVREDTPAGANVSFDELKAVVNKAVNETLNRTINTTLTVLFTTVAVWIFAGGSVRAFAANLTIGCVIGAYSSIFMAPTIYLFFRKHFYNPAAAAAKPAGPSKEERERGIV
jgi:preprotein translocase subunit SecF